MRYNTDGSLDAAFDSDGKVTTDFSSDMDGGKSIVIQSDRKIVVAGDVVTDGYHHYGVVRYNTDGSLDTAFGSDGKVTFDFNGNSGYASSVALQSDGKILIAGTSSSSTYDQFSIARLDSNGVMGQRLRQWGQVTTDFGSGSYAYGNVIQTDGKYVVGGSTDSDSYSSAALRATKLAAPSASVRCGR